MDNILIRVFSGETIEDKCRTQLHPINEVKRAKELVDLNTSIDCYSNSSDFVSAIKIYTLAKKIKVDFYLDEVNCGNDIEPIFESFNKSFEMMNELAVIGYDTQDLENRCREADFAPFDDRVPLDNSEFKWDMHTIEIAERWLKDNR